MKGFLTLPPSEFVLKRDGANVVTNSACASTSGTLVSAYDGATWTAVSDVDIDHMVPLKNAWVNGASKWTTAKREQFANDIASPQLWTVTDNLNQAKGDKSPDVWKPPLTSFYCTYAKSWVQVKYKWELSVTPAEKTALASMMDTCQEAGNVPVGSGGTVGSGGVRRGGLADSRTFWVVLGTYLVCFL